MPPRQRRAAFAASQAALWASTVEQAEATRCPYLKKATSDRVMPGASQQQRIAMPLNAMTGRRPSLIQCLVLGGLLFIATLRCEAQGNLAPNPSFENADTCAVQMGYLPNGRPQHWFPFSDTPDYYRSCVPEGSVNSVPQAFLIYQHPFHGESFSGLSPYSFHGWNYREMIGAELIESLVVGQTYYASMYVNAGTGGNGPTQYGVCSNNIGMLFTMAPHEWVLDMPPFSLRNHAQVYSPQVITDTLGWTLVSGSFVADSAYRYVVIGNHFTDENTLLDTIAVGVYDRAYMTVDAVCVSIDPEGCPLTTGVTDRTPSTIQLFPNPASGHVQVSGLNNGYREAVVADPVGRVVWSGGIAGRDRMVLDVGTWPMGQYLLVLSGEASRRSLRFVVMR